MAADVEGDVYVLVEHPFEYTGKDGRRVAIQPNERYRLLRRSTEHWWHVRREPGGRPFYLPAQYVRELPALGDPAAASPPDSENVYEAIQDVRGPPREERAQQALATWRKEVQPRALRLPVQPGQEAPHLSRLLGLEGAPGPRFPVLCREL
ncbi:rho GTPase-activating protein 27-like [Ailuropoda melanoleuca]|uniref:rho GTPase-activating protein 27-like n=1 Tax=Ailuropoda melanoleuca TaxID=9646 RepID=UPI0014942AE7|nr:rho GTPase-activating protein 27-like [Ailuropoda melanoleuca]